jgi:hypothetical protein
VNSVLRIYLLCLRIPHSSVHLSPPLQRAHADAEHAHHVRQQQHAAQLSLLQQQAERAQAQQQQRLAAAHQQILVLEASVIAERTRAQQSGVELTECRARLSAARAQCAEFERLIGEQVCARVCNRVQIFLVVMIF